MLNYGEIRTQVANLIERSDSSFATRIGGYINQRYRNIIDRRPWVALLRQYTVPTTANLDYIVLPKEINQVIDIHQTSTPIVVALERYYNRLRRVISTVPDTGLPVSASPVGVIGVKVKIPSNSTFTVESSNANDITQKVRVRGFNAAGLPITELVALTGTTPVATTNTYNASAGYEPWFSLDTDTLGYITVKSGTTTIAELGPDERDAKYSKWLLWPTPTSAVNLFVTGKMRPPLLEQTEDVPLIECQNALIQGAYAQCLQEKRQFSKAVQTWELYEQEVQILTDKEPQFSQNFDDAFQPKIERHEIDQNA